MELANAAALLAIDAAQEAALGIKVVAPKSHERTQAREVAIFAYRALESFGFIKGTAASATDAQHAIRGQFLPEVPQGRESAVSKAWDLLVPVLISRLASTDLTKDQVQSAEVASWITDDLLDSVIASDTFVRAA